MKITCIALTYGRVERLNECIESFLRQDYADKELIVLNTCPKQTLLGDFPNVQIVNLKARPSCLGEARNMAVELAGEGLIVTLDDDDMALPHYLSVFASHLTTNPEAKWVWADKEFYLEGGKIKKIAMGMMNTFAYTKEAWRLSGGYKAMNVGEDRDFAGRLTGALAGIRASVADDQIGYLYCWANGVYHVSGMGDDKLQQVNSWERTRRDLEAKISRGMVRTGKIQLQPKWKHDYVEMADAFIGGRKPVELVNVKVKTTICMVLLGRYGDIINILPVARMIAERWGKPVFMINREFASILRGVSYVQPHIFEPEYGQVKQAVALANASYSIVINAQIWGANFNLKKESPAFNLESWRVAGFEKEFHNQTLLPEFDLRDLGREEAIFKKLTNGKPLLLIKVHGALSAPFKSGQQLEALLRAAFEVDYQVLELGSMKTPEIYDLLGLYDRAALLVTIDTMTLHLAAASGVPVVALVNNDPWVSSIPRCHCVSKINYKIAEPNPELVVQAVAEALKTARHRPMPSVAAINPPTRKLFHAVERHDDKGSDQRKINAWKSWDVLYQNGVVPCHYWKYERDARSIGDKRALPYLKDVLQFAMNQAGDDDIIFFTNDDVILHPKIIELLIYHVSIFSACSSQRLDFQSISHTQLLNREALLKHGARHMGRDLFAFTKSWLVQHWDTIGDFILGASDWDLALASLIRLQHGILSNRKNLELVIHPAELPCGYLLHENHNQYWVLPNNVDSAPSQIHNRNLFRSWANQNLPSMQFFYKNMI